MDDMEYIESLTEIKKTKQALENLVHYCDKIYNLTMKKMYNLEKQGLQNTKEYEQSLKQLKILKLKEQRILNNISTITFEYYEEYIDDIIRKNTTSKTKRELLKSRIFYIITKIDIINDEYLEDEDKEEIMRRNECIKELELEFIIYNEENKNKEALKEKYIQSFINNDLETELLFAGFNPKELIKFTDEDKAKLYKQEIERFENEQQEFIYEYFIELIDNLLDSSQDPKANKTKIKNTINKIGFISKKLMSQDLILIKEDLETELEDDNTIPLSEDISVLESVLNTIQNELQLRGDLPQINFEEEIEENEEIEYYTKGLSENQIDNIISLIKQAKITYDIGMKMCVLEIKNQNTDIEFQKCFEALKDSHNKEKEIANKIKLTPKETEIIIDVLEKYLNILTAEDLGIDNLDYPRLSDEIVKQRIINLLPGLYEVDSSVYKDPLVPEFIIQSHLIEVLKQFDKKIKKENNPAALILVKYEEIISNVDLTDDFINANGIIENITNFDDETLAKILEIDLEEYQFDKSELLYNYTILIIQSILETLPEETSPIEKARLLLQSIFIEKAQESISEEKEITFQESQETKIKTYK